MVEMARLKLLITNFYKTLFEFHVGNRFDELLNQVHRKVSPEMNDILMKEYRDEEIKQALDNMDDLKALGWTVCLLFFITNTGILLGSML